LIDHVNEHNSYVFAHVLVLQVEESLDQRESCLHLFHACQLQLGPPPHHLGRLIQVWQTIFIFISLRFLPTSMGDGVVFHKLNVLMNERTANL
jgi:hypothetical protein